MVKYFFSESLGLKGKLDTETGIIVINDRDPDGKFVTYSREENQILRETVGIIDKKTHMVKKIFSGIIIDPREKRVYS